MLRPYVGMTLLVIVWSLFAAPTWCGAVNRKRGAEVEYCRNNASGLLLGCRIRQHKFDRAPWGGGLSSDPRCLSRRPEWRRQVQYRWLV